MRTFAPLLVMVLMGCPIGNNKYPKPADLSPSWKVDKLRVLAIRADPPEIRPGEEALFDALIVDPAGTAGLIAWIACPPADADGVGFGCGLDAAIDFENPTPAELEEAGVIGLQPLFNPRYTAPIDTLAEVEAAGLEEGLYVLVQTAVLPAAVLDDPSATAGGFDFNDVEVAYKRLIVSEADTPNLNPSIHGWTVDQIAIPPDTVVEVEPGQPYDFGIQLSDGSVQVYTYTNPEGRVEERIEEPYAKWYADGGTVLEDTTLFPYLESTWRAPDPTAEGSEGEPTTGTLWAVVRDRRGGMTWSSLRWKLQGSD